MGAHPTGNFPLEASSVCIGSSSSMGVLRLAQPNWFKLLCKDQVPVYLTAENPWEEFLINNFHLKYLLLDYKWKYETCKLSVSDNL